MDRIRYSWNNLPENLRTEDLSLSCFKKHCRDFYKNGDFDPGHKIVVLSFDIISSLYVLLFGELFPFLSLILHFKTSSYGS